MTRTAARLAIVAVFIAACATAGPSASPPGASSVPASAGASPSALASQQPTVSAVPVEVPPGRILFERPGSDGKEHYFTINSDGTDQREIYTREACGCAMWSADGARVMSLDATGHGTFSLMTIRPDGTDRVVIASPIKTLNLTPAASSVNGRRIAFAGWDETDPSHDGIYVASPDLANLKFVTPIPRGHVSVEPFGVAPDGSRIVFFADRGKTEHAEGDLYVVNADGSALRQLNPPGTTHNFVDVASGSLSPDGRRVAFGVEGRIFVANLAGGKAQPITDPADFVWAVSWSPTGEWIAYTRQFGSTSVVALVRPDGGDQKEISPSKGSDETARGRWSPTGDALVVLRGVDALHDLWILDLEGTFIGQITHEPSDYAWFSWAPATGS